jgi:hypothetical protein
MDSRLTKTDEKDAAQGEITAALCAFLLPRSGIFCDHTYKRDFIFAHA